MINEKCFAPLPQAVMQSAKKFCPFFKKKKKKKREKIADVKVVDSWCPAKLFACGPGWRLPGSGVPACCLPSLYCKVLPARISHFLGIHESLRPIRPAGKLSYATSANHYR